MNADQSGVFWVNFQLGPSSIQFNCKLLISLIKFYHDTKKEYTTGKRLNAHPSNQPYFDQRRTNIIPLHTHNLPFPPISPSLPVTYPRPRVAIPASACTYAFIPYIARRLHRGCSRREALINEDSSSRAPPAHNSCGANVKRRPRTCFARGPPQRVYIYRTRAHSTHTYAHAAYTAPHPPYHPCKHRGRAHRRQLD